MIDWSKLKPYDNNKAKSFEELCFQIAQVLYGNQGRFTSIDDSGGGDGVEFYMTLPNGDQWGWQAKFYYPDKRLNSSKSRKKEIENSLKTSCKKHPSLKKWFLCTPTNLTPNKKVKGKEQKGEKDWFDNTLIKSVPPNMEVEIIHWGDSDFNSWLSEPRFNGKKNYFFGELELNLEWFRTQFDKQISSIGDKFNSVLHTETKIDFDIHQVLCDNKFTLYIEQQIDIIKTKINEYNEAVAQLAEKRIKQFNHKAWLYIKLEILTFSSFLKKLLFQALEYLKQLKDYLLMCKYDDVRSLDLTKIRTRMQEAKVKIKKLEQNLDICIWNIPYTGKDEDKERTYLNASSEAFQPLRLADNLISKFTKIFKQIDSINQVDLHILGDAGFGKTHVVSNICDERLNSRLPALLILGIRFTNYSSLEQQLLDILDIPRIYSWNNFLQALDAAAEAYRTRIPIFIDALNEATSNGVFSQVWQGLPGLVQEIGEFKNLVLITTCRTTYKKVIWDNNPPKNIKYIDGFDIENLEQAVEKYFNYYNIKADLTAIPLEQFTHPIYLQIFCKSKNPDRQSEKYIYIGAQTLFEVFDEYLNQCNQMICKKLGFYYKTDIVIKSLTKIAQELWNSKNRNLSLVKLVEIVDHKPSNDLNWEKSKSKAILDENLLICRDWRADQEVVYFTYDLLCGYLIARYIIEEADKNIQSLIQSENLTNTLFSKNFRELHPLYSDIGRCLAALIPVKTGLYLHNIIDNSEAYELSIRALFEISPSHINEECVNLVATLFTHSSNRVLLLDLAIFTIPDVQHPFNAIFWSKQLKLLEMSDRDISWTEYIRENLEKFEKTITQFEGTCKNQESLSEMMEKRLDLLAVYIMWVLTSTVRPLRDKATRALYWYGRRQPKQFLDLVLESLEINDPYVFERMLAATYGVAMARQYDFNDHSFAKDILPLYGRQLYQLMFQPNAPYSTTHILTRDYAKRTIDIALLHHPNLLNYEEKLRITPPFKDGGIRDWGQSGDNNPKRDLGGNFPLHMDFENYTLGRLVKGRNNYDYNHPEYQIVLVNILWRIDNLGYSIDIFGDIDQFINHYNWNKGNGIKTDRYGKKYSWIAFYELAGLRQDNNLLDIWDEESRISDADIDPSFPEKTKEYNLVKEDLLGNRDIPIHEWILQGEDPDFKPYLVVDDLIGEKGKWVLLDGYINQEDYQFQRDRFTFLRGLIVNNEEAESILNRLEKQNFGNRWLPEIPNDYYTYAGEIPWCDTYRLNGYTKLSFKVLFALVRDGKTISEEEGMQFIERIEHLLNRNDEDEDIIESTIQDNRLATVDTISEEIAQPESTEVDNPIRTAIKQNGLDLVETTDEEIAQLKSTETFDVLIPVRNNSWEEYHSAITPGINVTIPAKEIAQHLNLCSQPQTYDLFEKNGRRASISFRYSEDKKTTQYFTYLRLDLLEKFLLETDSELIWAIWGERMFEGNRSQRDAFAMQHEYYKVFQQVKSYSDFNF